MNIREALAAAAERIDWALAEEVRDRTGGLAALEPHLAPALSQLQEYLGRPGKRLRGTLVLWGARAAGGVEENVLPAAVAVELFHAHLLILDDIMDADRVRRGGPALHVALAGHGGDEPRGAALASTLAGLVHAWALSLLSSCRVQPEALRAALAVWARMLAAVNAGQALDVAPPPLEELDEGYVRRMHALKSAAYTFTGPLSLGLALCGAERPQVQALEIYGNHAGEAFQIADDLLGAFGDPAITGKPSGADLRAGKRTRLVAAALDLAGPGRPALLEALAGPLDDSALDALRAQLRALGAEERCRQIAHAEVHRAQQALAQAPLSSTLRALLAGLAALGADRTA